MRLRVEFESAEAFRREYAQNLVNGGVFLPTHEPFRLREIVEVELGLAGSDVSVRLEGEVVHIVPAEMAGMGGTPGVAVQITGASHEVRRRLEPLAAATGTFQYRPVDPGRRGARRTSARLTARISDLAGASVVEGRTRDLSRTGVLVAVHGDRIPVGRPVQLLLTHPTHREDLELPGVVVREETGDDGQVVALAIQFDPPSSKREQIEAWIENLQSVEHARGLGGIAGAIEELGMGALMQMFGKGPSAGTLALRREAEEATLVFENGLLRHARLGTVTGVKALVRLMRWQDGSFEFHARLDPDVPRNEAPLPLDVALLEAARQLDESARAEPQAFSPTARVCRGDADALPGDSPSKVEAALLDLARAGSFTVQRVVDLIPEPDFEILGALRALIDRGAVRLDG